MSATATGQLDKAMSQITDIRKAHAKAEQDHSSEAVELNKRIDALLKRAKEYEFQQQTQAGELQESTAKLGQEEQELLTLKQKLMEARSEIEVLASHTAAQSHLSAHVLIRTGGQRCKGGAGYRVGP